ncbi:5394_t:CDS:2, partial [Racocetra persica]
TLERRAVMSLQANGCPLEFFGVHLATLPQIARRSSFDEPIRMSSLFHLPTWIETRKETRNLLFAIEKT